MRDETRDRQLMKLRRELGTAMLDALSDDNVIEIMRNPDGQLWIETLAYGKRSAGTMPATQAESIVATIAAMQGTVVTHDRPFLECEFPLDHSRFTALVPPVVSSIAFTLRLKPKRIFTLNDYLAAEVLNESQASALSQAIASRRNILVAGGTGSGKTTLLNALLHAISVRTPSDRVVIIEDTSEIQCAIEDVVTLRAIDQFSMLRCLRSTMRLRPERIVVGEVRGGEVMTLLKSWNTGHQGGLATVHANSALLSLTRLQSLMAEAPETANYPHALQRDLIGEAVDLVVFIAKDNSAPNGRLVKEIVAIDGFDHARREYRVHQVAPSKSPPKPAFYIH